jgi:hypothetical protein
MLENNNFASCFVWVQQIVALRGEHKLQAIENKVQTKMSGCKRDEANVQCRRSVRK